jgi:hypothetical protein
VIVPARGVAQLVNNSRDCSIIGFDVPDWRGGWVRFQDIRVQFKAFAAFGNEATGYFIQTRSYHLESVVRLRKQSFEGSDFLL